MRCHYLSDLHLESQDFRGTLPKGDLLIIAGDLCHARCLDPARTDKYSIDQRIRMLRFVDSAVTNFAHVLLIAGNHEHYDGVFDDTAGLLRRNLPGVTVFDNEHVEIDGIRFFGTTLWSNFEERSEASMNAVRRRMGEFFFVKRRSFNADGHESLARSVLDLTTIVDQLAAKRVDLRVIDQARIAVISGPTPTRRRQLFVASHGQARYLR